MQCPASPLAQAGSFADAPWALFESVELAASFSHYVELLKLIVLALSYSVSVGNIGDKKFRGRKTSRYIDVQHQAYDERNVADRTRLLLYVLHSSQSQW